METTSRPACEACGAALPPAARWCSLCLAPRALRSDVEPVRDVRAGPPPARPVGPYSNRLVPRYSRWQGGVTSFGPRGRVVATVLAFLPLYWAVFYAGLFGLAFAILWILVGLPVVLRDVWKRERIGYGPPER